jgi:hypothetical protein
VDEETGKGLPPYGLDCALIESTYTLFGSGYAGLGYWVIRY